jgi:hypothetical protein
MNPRKEVDLHKLWMVTADADDYFCRMGGAGRYSGFSAWHVPGLVLMLLSGVNPSARDFLNTQDSYEISPRIWRETDGLPGRLAAELNGRVCSPEVFESYLKKMVERVAEISSSSDLFDWSKFLVRNEDRFASFK